MRFRLQAVCRSEYVSSPTSSGSPSGQRDTAVPHIAASTSNASNIATGTSRREHATHSAKILYRKYYISIYYSAMNTQYLVPAHAYAYAHAREGAHDGVGTGTGT